MQANVHIFKNSDELSLSAARSFVKTAQQALKDRRRFLVALSGGGTPRKLFALLATLPLCDQVNWAQTFVFWADERCVSTDDDGSNFGQAWRMLFQHVPIPAQNLLRVNTNLEPVDAATDYVRILKRFSTPPFDWPRFDLVLLGMGADGHTASLFPGSPVESVAPTLAVAANYQGRPAKRVTLTPLVFNAARQVVFMVTGENKAVTLSRVLSDISMLGEFPAQRIQPVDGSLTWLVDEAAASKLSN